MMTEVKDTTVRERGARWRTGLACISGRAPCSGSASGIAPGCSSRTAWPLDCLGRSRRARLSPSPPPILPELRNWPPREAWWFEAARRSERGRVPLGGSYSARGAPSLSWAELRRGLSPEACVLQAGPKRHRRAQWRCEAEAGQASASGQAFESPLRRVGQERLILGAVRPVSRGILRRSGAARRGPPRNVSTSPARAVRG